VDVREAAAVEEVQDPRRHGRAEVLVEPGHGSGLDRARPARPHHELVAGAELLHEGTEEAEVVRAVGVSHEEVLAADVRKRVDVRASEASSRRLQDARPVLERDLGRAIRRAVDDDDLADHARRVETLVAPVDELPDGHLLVEGGDHDRELGLDGVRARYEQPDLGIDADWAKGSGLGGPSLAHGHAPGHVSGSHRRPR
jgi:hypothetical protein